MTDIEQTMEQRAAKLGELLLNAGWRMATAESCTGGWIAQCATAIAGSSDWFDRGFVTYSNEAKHEVLGVTMETLAKHGAVSRESAGEMAAGALRAAKVDITVAVTGIAGPGGGSSEKPVGTVWFGWCLVGKPPQTAHQCFSGDRKSVREQTVIFAFDRMIEAVGG